MGKSKGKESWRGRLRKATLTSLNEANGQQGEEPRIELSVAALAEMRDALTHLKEFLGECPTGEESREDKMLKASLRSVKEVKNDCTKAMNTTNDTS